MEETTTKTVKKTLCFEKSGETLSVELCLENVSPHTIKKTTILNALDALFKEAKDAIC